MPHSVCPAPPDACGGGIRITNASVTSVQDLAARTRAAPCFQSNAPQLLRLKTCIVSVNVMEYLKNGSIIINGIELRDADIFARIDTAGNANFNILAQTDTIIADTLPAAASGKPLFDSIQLAFFKIRNANVFYENQKQGISACISGLDLTADGDYIHRQGRGNLSVGAAQIAFAAPSVNGGAGSASIDVRAEYQNRTAAARLSLGLNGVSFALRDTLMADRLALKAAADLVFDQNQSRLLLNDASVQVNDLSFSTNGVVQTDTAFGFWDMRLAYSLGIPSIEDALKMIPTAILPQAKGIKMQGSIALKGNAVGVFRDSASLPAVNGALTADLGGIRAPNLPCGIDKLTAALNFNIDLNKRQPSFANIAGVGVRAAEAGADLRVQGRITDLLGDPLLDLKIKAAANLDKAIGVAAKLADLGGIELAGALDADIHTFLRVSDAAGGSIERLNAGGALTFKDLHYRSPKDTMTASLGGLALSFRAGDRAPAFHNGSPHTSVSIKIDNLRAQAGAALRASVRRAAFDIRAANVQDSARLPVASCNFNLEGARLRADSIRLRARSIGGIAALKPSAGSPLKPDVDLTLQTDSVRAYAFGNVLSLHSGKTQAKAHQDSDTTQGFKGWKARLHLDYNAAQVFAPSFPERIYIDKLRADATDAEQRLEQCEVRIGDSDFQLSGSVADLLAYLDKKKTLKTALTLTAGNIDLNQLIRISEAGSKTQAPAHIDAESPDYEARLQQSVHIDTTPPKMGAIMLPRDIEAKFETSIKAVSFGTMDLQNVKGGVTLADGAVILQELGVVAHKRTKMNLTAIYRTPERSHIFAGISYHLMDVQLGSLQEIIPDVDTVLPMLRSFEGNVDFHLVAQTYLDSNYNIKFSTLRAASSIRGDSLVVLDGETFATISKYLMFKNKKRNMIDSLSVELVVFKNQVELYPFVIGMDRYKVAVGGRHNLDMTFNYHASILESPLPKRLGVDISGTLAKPKIKLAPCRYESMFVPAKKGVVQSSQMEIRDQIRKALTKTK